MTLETKARITQIGKQCAALLLWCAAPAAYASTDIWTGGGSGSTWSDASNWAAHASPSPYDSLVFQGSTGTSPNNDLVSLISSSIAFSNNASAFVLSGNAVTLSHFGTSNTIGITNGSASAQTVSQDISLDWGNYTFASTGSGLALNGQLTAPAGSIALLGDNLTSSSLTVDAQGLISGLGGAALKYAGGSTFSGLATISGGSIGAYTPSTQVGSGALGDTTQAAPLNIGVTAAPGSGSRVTYTLSGGTSYTYANTLLVNDAYAGTIQIGNDAGAGQYGELILGSSADNWLGGVYVYGSPATTAVILTNQFLTAGPGSGAPTAGTVVLAVNGTSGNNYMNVYSAVTNNPSGGAVSLVKTGPGGVFFSPILRGQYSGGTYINQGTFQLAANNAACVSAGPYYVAANAGFYIRDSMTNDITISPGINNAYAAAIKLENYTLSGKLTLAGSPVTAPPGNRIAMNNNPTLSGKITGTGTLEITPSSTSGWNLTLNNTSATATNDWTGGLILNGPSSQLANVTVTLGSANQLNGNNVSFFSAGKNDVLNLNGKNDTVGALITTNTALTTACMVTNGATTSCTLGVGGNNASGTFYGLVVDGGASRALNLVKVGSGTQTFGGSLTYAGTTIVNGGTLAFALNTAFPFNSTSVSVNSNATLDVSAITPLTMGTLNLSNATVVLGAASGILTVTNFGALGSSNYVKLTSLPPVSAYPAQFRVIAYNNLASGPLNFGLAGLPAVAAGTPYAGYISNNAANNSVDLVLTAGPVGIIWSGATSSSWDTGTPNWQTVSGGATTYIDGENVTFPDSAALAAKSVTLAQTVAPLSMVVSNTGATPYTFSDGNAGYLLTAAGSLTKQGAGTLLFDGSGNSSFAGGIVISAGTVQIGNNDGNGSVTASLVNDNASLVIARNDSPTFASPIQGNGGVVIQGGGTITLSGANSYTNTTQITGNSILKAGNNAALGSAVGPTIINSGSTLDVNGRNLGMENVQAIGTGTSGQGAIDNTGASQVNALASVTLLGDTTFGTSASRWDLRSPVSGATNALLSTGGHAYNLTKIGSQPVLLVDTFVDPALANIDIQGGTFGLQGVTTGLGNPSAAVTVEPGATLFTYALTTPLNKIISLAGTLQHGSASATVSGPITLAGSSVVEVAPSSTLNLNGAISGGNGLSMYPYPSSSSSGTLNFNGTNTYTGGLTIYQGTVNLNGNHVNATGGVNLNGGSLFVNNVLGGSLITAISTALGGTGAVLGTAEVDGTFNPGASANTAGTFIAGNGITFDADSVLTFDLAATNTIGAGINDYLIVTNDVTPNGNIISINLLAGSLQPGTYHLISYSGNLNGSFAGVQTASPTSQIMTLDTSVPGQVNLIVSGTPDILKWNSATTNNWDNDPGSTNWLSLGGNTNAPFNGGNYVLFDDTPNVVTGINVASGVTVLPAGITNNSSTNNFTISGAGSIGGGGKLVKSGSSTLTLGTANDISGVTVSGGILSVANVTALGRTNVATVVNSGATLDVGGLNLGRYAIIASGAGAGGLGAIVNNGASQISALLNVTLAGDTTVGGSNRWDLRATSATSSNAVLSTGGHAYNLTKVGTNQVWLVDALLDPALGNINLTSGLLGIQSTTTIGNPTNTLTISSNADLAFYQASNVFAKVIVMNDGAILETANSANVIGGKVTLNGNGYFIGAGPSLALTNVISGSGSLIKTNGASQLILSAANTYTGNTTISGGNLLLTGNGSISGSATITLNGAAIDVSGRTDKTLTLAAGQTLRSAPNGTVNGGLTSSVGATVSPGGTGTRGTLTVTNAVTLLGTTSMDLDEAAHTNDLITSTGGVTYGGTLNVSVISGTPAGGEAYKLFNAGSYSGSFSATNLPALGTGLGWKWNPVNGTLSVIQTVNLTPTNLVVSISGNQMILSWPADHTGWQIQAQTNNLGAGLGTNWVTLPGSGSVNAITNLIDPNNGGVFYRMIY